MPGRAACERCGCLALRGVHYLGPLSDGSFRIQLATCPLDPQHAADADELVETYLDSLAFPGVPLQGTSMMDHDLRIHRAVRLLRAEQTFVELALAADERAKREAHRHG